MSGFVNTHELLVKNIFRVVDWLFIDSSLNYVEILKNIASHNAKDASICRTWSNVGGK